MLQVLTWIILGTSCYVEAEEVTVKQGILEGVKLPLVIGNGSYYSFKGIPYAAAPIGERRFQHPYPPENWEGVRNATTHGNVCLQPDSSPKGSEDCLFLNVYTPTLEKGKRGLPVMIYIHGGGFLVGSGNDEVFGPDYLLQHGVVLVTFNYRLGPFGFLSLGTDQVPGNAGLKDQVAAFQWVRDNIDQFGGDPKNVTILGQSAGGVSVCLHMLSPMSTGLFHKAMAISGTALFEWTLPFESEKRAFALGRLLGLYTTDKNVLLDFLRNVNASNLVGLTPTVLANEEQTTFVKTSFYTYTIEKQSGRKPFLTKDPLEILKERVTNKVDFMLGRMTSEYLNIYSPQIAPRYETYLELFAPKRILNYVPPATAFKVAQILKTHYFKNKTVSNETNEILISYFNDVGFNYDTYKYISYLGDSDHHGRYLFVLSAVCGRNIYSNSKARELGLPPASSHSDDYFYMFDPKQFNLTMTKDSNEYKLVQQYTTLLTNFAKYGNPTPSWIKDDKYLGKTSWPKYNSKTKPYLDFGTSAMTVRNSLDADTISLFDHIYKMAHIDY